MTVLIVVAVVAWLAIIVGVVAMCRTAAAGDAANGCDEPEPASLPDPGETVDSDAAERPASRNPG